MSKMTKGNGHCSAAHETLTALGMESVFYGFETLNNT
jgi:hypothetical protein